eukprot:Skav233996  [mRNA]  locus=scaffold2413:96696:99909:+ [translate_table: standard]
MFHVNVGFPSGRSESFPLLPSSTIADLKLMVQKTFHRGFLRLVTAEGRILVGKESLQAAGIQQGDHLVAIAQRASVAATARTQRNSGSAFALWCKGDDKVITWGHPAYGSDSSAVQDRLSGVQHIQATSGAFAAILEDGSVVTWGRPYFGGDSSAVQNRLSGVAAHSGHECDRSAGAFAAILEDGSVVTWGCPNFGGDSSAVQDRLRGVQHIQPTNRAFAAILEDGSIVTWGDPGFGGNSTAVQDQLRVW